MANRELGEAPKGGILADEQGLGKTVQTVALMLRNLPPPDEEEDSDLVLKADHPPMRTLIVAPVALLRQWEEELRRFSG